MSGLSAQITVPNDLRALSHFYQDEVEIIDFGNLEAGDFTTGYWPGTGGVNGFQGDSETVTSNSYWGLPDPQGGANFRYGVIGVTRDVNGTPLGGVTVKLYRTSTDEMVSAQVSDPVGNFLCSTPYYPDTHYLVTYKAGFPDVFATTVNTLTGA